VIPVLLELGLIAGLIPVLKWWFAPIAGVGWAVVIASTPNDIGPALLVGAFAIGAINALVGWGVGRALLRAVQFVVRRMKHSAAKA